MNTIEHVFLAHSEGRSILSANLKFSNNSYIEKTRYFPVRINNHSKWMNIHE